jgi:DNA polymerase-3 subunit delta'
MAGADEPAGEAGRYLTQGHGQALRVVERAVETERPPHALLLLGPKGVGKTTLALDLAAGLLCLQDDRACRPCRSCLACRKVGLGQHPDLHHVEPEGPGEQIRLPQVQRLGIELALMPLEGRFRVALITSAQRLNPDAQNALLKTLEEPGPATCLMLCADEAAPLLPTVISRTARLRLTSLPVEALTAWLLERGHADPAPARAIAIASQGRPGLALRLAKHPEAVLARGRIGRTLLGLVHADRRSRLAAAPDLVADAAVVAAALREEVPPSAARLEPAERRRAVAVVIDVWRDIGRDLAMAARTGGRGVRDRDQLDELVVTAATIDAGALRPFLDRLDRLMLAVEGYASPELALDVLLLAWPGLARPDAGPGARADARGTRADRRPGRVRGGAADDDGTA